MKNKILKWLNDYLYLLVIGFLTIIIGLYQPILGAIGGILLGYLIFHNIKNIKRKEEEIKKYVEGLSDEFESATKHAIFNMPFPLVMVDENGSIRWYNTPFLKMVDDPDILHQNITSLIPGFSIEGMLKEELKALDIKYKDKHYKIYPNLVDTSKTSSPNNMIIMLYWVDNTKFVELAQNISMKN